MGYRQVKPSILVEDEVFAGVPDHKINGKQHYLWRAVDQDGEVVDVYLQAKRDGVAEIQVC
ncbi:MAG: DDE-type integrase/transposase/recombinase [Halioglobus sp.]